MEKHGPLGLREARHGGHEGVNFEQEPLLAYRADTPAWLVRLLNEYLTRLKLFREVVAARVPYYGQQVLPHSNLLDPHFRSQFAVFLEIGRRKVRASRPRRAARFLISFCLTCPFPWLAIDNDDIVVADIGYSAVRARKRASEYTTRC